MMDPVDHASRRARNLRTGLIMGSIALAVFVGFMIKVISLQ